MTDVNALWAAIDPDRPVTLDAALDHLRHSLAGGRCPFCPGFLHEMDEMELLICERCGRGFPPNTPGGSMKDQNPQSRELVAQTLRLMSLPVDL